MKHLKVVSCVAISAASLALLAAPSFGNDFSIATMARGGNGGGGPPFVPASSCTGTASGGGTIWCWMDTSVADAWSNNLNGGSFKDSNGGIHFPAVTFVDDFNSTNTISGNLGPEGKMVSELHSYWTTEEMGLIATAQVGHTINHDFNNETGLTFDTSTFNVVNASYGMIGTAKGTIDWTQYPNEVSLIDAAMQGNALISKAAGNDGVAIGSTVHGKVDYLSTGLKNGDGATTYTPISFPTVIYAGALNSSGNYTSSSSLAADGSGSSMITPSNTLASYSDYPGSDAYYQTHFLVVPVDYTDTGLAGTSFAAPVITAYAAIIAQKYSTTSASDVTSQLLKSAYWDTNWGPKNSITQQTYGMGEACLACALSPTSIMQ